jgi:hypothetical protein
LQAEPEVQSRDQQNSKIRPDIGVGDDAFHRLAILQARQRAHRRMGMPFAEIVEPAIIAAGPFEELIEKFSMMSRISDEAGLRSASALHGDVGDPKYFSADMFADQYAADLAPPGGCEFFAQHFHHVAWKQDVQGSST